MGLVNGNQNRTNQGRSRFSATACEILNNQREEKNGSTQTEAQYHKIAKKP